MEKMWSMESMERIEFGVEPRFADRLNSALSLFSFMGPAHGHLHFNLGERPDSKLSNVDETSFELVCPG